MEGGELGLGAEEILAVPLPELDRAAVASHCAAVAHHMACLARIFDPACKAAADAPKKHRKAHAVEGEEDKTRPKRELTQYNLFMQSRLQQIKLERPDLPHTTAFSLAAAAWKTDVSNPKAHTGDDSSKKHKAEDSGGAGPAGDDKKHKKAKKEDEEDDM